MSSRRPRTQEDVADASGFRRLGTNGDNTERSSSLAPERTSWSSHWPARKSAGSAAGQTLATASQFWRAMSASACSNSRYREPSSRLQSTPPRSNASAASRTTAGNRS